MDLAYPFHGRWLVQNSPADRIPSHGTARFASAYAIDFVPVDQSGRTAAFTPRSLVRSEPAESFPGFGRAILAPMDGVVAAVYDGAEDHAAHRGLRSLGYALMQRRRSRGGWQSLAGNHVLLQADAGSVVALCHLRQGSAAVREGQRVAVGDLLGACGNSGNSTEPHLHLQAFDHRDPRHAHAVPVTFGSGLPRGGEVVDV